MRGPMFPHDPSSAGCDVPLYPPGLQVVDMLQVLVERGMIRTVDDLITQVRESGYPEMVTVLERLRDEQAPPWLAIQALRVEVELAARRTWRKLEERLAGRRLGLLPPLAFHLVSRLSAHATDLLLPLGDAHLPSELHSLACSRHLGFRASRRAALTCGAIAFEAYPEASCYHVQPSILDVLEAVASRPSSCPLLIVHARPLALPGDLPFELEGADFLV